MSSSIRFPTLRLPHVVRIGVVLHLASLSCVVKVVGGMFLSRVAKPAAVRPVAAIQKLRSVRSGPLASATIPNYPGSVSLLPPPYAAQQYTEHNDSRTMQANAGYLLMLLTGGGGVMNCDIISDYKKEIMTDIWGTGAASDAGSRSRAPSAQRALRGPQPGEETAPAGEPASSKSDSVPYNAESVPDKHSGPAPAVEAGDVLPDAAETVSQAQAADEIVVHGDTASLVSDDVTVDFTSLSPAIVTASINYLRYRRTLPTHQKRELEEFKSALEVVWYLKRHAADEHRNFYSHARHSRGGSIDTLFDICPLSDCEIYRLMRSYFGRFEVARKEDVAQSSAKQKEYPVYWSGGMGPSTPFFPERDGPLASDGADSERMELRADFVNVFREFVQLHNYKNDVIADSVVYNEFEALVEKLQGYLTAK